MREAFGPPLKAAAVLAFFTGLAMLLLNPPSFGGLEDLLTILAVVAAVVLLTAWGTVALIGKEMTEEEYERLTARSEALAYTPQVPREWTEFDDLVAAALDDLPPEFQDLLYETPVVISDRGAEHHAYGHYIGDTVARENFPDRIVIYRDTLVRDFGHDPELLRAQVERTVRHELAHHLGWDEDGVRNLGL